MCPSWVIECHPARRQRQRPKVKQFKQNTLWFGVASAQARVARLMLFASSRTRALPSVIRTSRSHINHHQSTHASGTSAQCTVQRAETSPCLVCSVRVRSSGRSASTAVVNAWRSAALSHVHGACSSEHPRGHTHGTL
jgi:hypothetical protein